MLRRAAPSQKRRSGEFEAAGSSLARKASPLDDSKPQRGAKARAANKLKDAEDHEYGEDNEKENTEKNGVVSAFGSNLSKDDHEGFIKRILSKPFKVPIPNYSGKSIGGLGVRKQTVRRCPFDPQEEGALVSICVNIVKNYGGVHLTNPKENIFTIRYKIF